MNRYKDEILSVAAQLSDEKPLQSYAGMRERVEESLHYLMAAMFPNFFCAGQFCAVPIPAVDDALPYLQQGAETLRTAIGYVVEDAAEADAMTLQLLRALPEIQDTLKSDVRAAYEGDPAARSEAEITLTYPAFTAIGFYRIANRLFRMGLPMIPRMMTEYAHRITGIDIHPGATIGRRFFIDHGTGVVIGETCTIGEHVKLYQHVTLGAKSFAVEEDGTLVKGIKRHPDIGNDVVIYAGATILGGDTVIGDGCVIGGNVWLTHSVPAGETVLATAAREKKKRTQDGIDD